MKIIQQHLLPALMVLNAAFFLTVSVSCTGVAPTVERFPAAKTPVVQESSTLRPQIQLVYPGTLQSLDYPKSYPTDIDPGAADIIIVFSHVMENSSNEMETSIELRENGEIIAASITPHNPVEDPTGTFICARSYTVSPLIADEINSGRFKECSEYVLRIYKFAHVNNEVDRPLNFENLIELPATSLDPINPNYVEYSFITGGFSEKDTIPPEITAVSPQDNASDVRPSDYITGYMEIIFTDNIIPMIDPATVDSNTVGLYDITAGAALSIRTEMDTGDHDFKTFRIYPLDPLSSYREYRLRISIDSNISDFQGNSVTEKDIHFTTGP